MAKIGRVHSEEGPPSVTKIKRVEVSAPPEPKAQKEYRANTRAERLAKKRAQQAQQPTTSSSAPSPAKKRRMRQEKRKVYQMAREADRARRDNK
jgi:hypothetical protein